MWRILIGNFVLVDLGKVGFMIYHGSRSIHIPSSFLKEKKVGVYRTTGRIQLLGSLVEENRGIHTSISTYKDMYWYTASVVVNSY